MLLFRNVAFDFLKHITLEITFNCLYVFTNCKIEYPFSKVPFSAENAVLHNP